MGDGVGVLFEGGGGDLAREDEEVLVKEANEVLVGEANRVLVGEVDGDLVGETDGVLFGEADGDWFSSSIIMGLEGGEPSTNSESSWVFVLVSRRSNRTLLGFLVDEDDSISESFYSFVISCRACSLAASHSDPRDKNLCLFLFVSLVLVG